MVLPQQVGIDLGVLNYKTGVEYRHGLLQPQFHNAPVVRMGHHAYDGSFSSISFANSNVNFTVESAIEKSASALGTDNVVVVSTNASAADATNLAVVVHPSAFWGAAANITFVDADPPRLELDSGELGVVSITFSHPASPLNQKDPTALVFNVTTEAPLVLWFTFEAAKADPDYTVASKVIEVQRAVVIADIQAAATLSKSSFDVSDAMASAIAWNVNFDPRVAVTAPVSRTFEAGFDFIFFDVSRSTGCSTDPCWVFSLPRTESGTLTSHYPHASQWDMFFLSLMASSMPAANNPHAFAIGVSNLIEVAQTRSAYGQVMNKRAASGSSTSDTNDRTEPYVPPLSHACSAKPPMLLAANRTHARPGVRAPLRSAVWVTGCSFDPPSLTSQCITTCSIVGSMVVLKLWEDAQGSPREATMQWVVELLFPTLLRWNEWCWESRRYFGSGPGSGLLVLGSDNHLPCEGSTVGQNSSRQVCASSYAAILEVCCTPCRLSSAL